LLECGEKARIRPAPSEKEAGWHVLLHRHRDICSPLGAPRQGIGNLRREFFPLDGTHGRRTSRWPSGLSVPPKEKCLPSFGCFGSPWRKPGPSARPAPGAWLACKRFFPLTEGGPPSGPLGAGRDGALACLGVFGSFFLFFFQKHPPSRGGGIEREKPIRGGVVGALSPFWASVKPVRYVGVGGGCLAGLPRGAFPAVPSGEASKPRRTAGPSRVLTFFVFSVHGPSVPCAGPSIGEKPCP